MQYAAFVEISELFSILIKIIPLQAYERTLDPKRLLNFPCVQRVEITQIKFFLPSCGTTNSPDTYFNFYTISYKVQRACNASFIYAEVVVVCIQFQSCKIHYHFFLKKLYITSNELRFNLSIFDNLRRDFEFISSRSSLQGLAGPFCQTKRYYVSDTSSSAGSQN